MEYVCGGDRPCGTGRPTCRGCHRSLRRPAPTPARHYRRGGGAHRYARCGAEPRLGRRTRPRIARPRGRRTRHRQIDPRPTDRPPPHRPPHALRLRRGERPPAQDARRPPLLRRRRGHGALPRLLRDAPRTDPRPRRSPQARPDDHRLDPNDVHRGGRVVAGQRYAGQGVQRGHPQVRQRDRHAGPYDRAY